MKGQVRRHDALYCSRQRTLPQRYQGFEARAIIASLYRRQLVSLLDRKSSQDCGD